VADRASTMPRKVTEDGFDVRFVRAKRFISGICCRKNPKSSGVPAGMGATPLYRARSGQETLAIIYPLTRLAKRHLLCQLGVQDVALRTRVFRRRQGEISESVAVSQHRCARLAEPLGAPG
jgi:hypothetical protein